MKKKVLLVDNDNDFLDTRADRLQREGYFVYRAYSYEQALDFLERKWIHLAIIDLRLRDDTDDKDTTGIALAKLPAYRAIPKIMLTRYPSFEYVREVLGPTLEDLPPAVNFIAKQEGPRAMIQALEDAFETHLQINPSLVIQPNQQSPVTLPHLVSLIEPTLPPEDLPDRAVEIEDLLRRLFYDKEQIRIGPLLWQAEGRAALSLFAFAKGQVPESLVVVCGNPAVMRQETTLFRQIGPQLPTEHGTILRNTARTSHFAANAYQLMGAQLEHLQSLKPFYGTAATKVLNETLISLFQKTLQAWHQETRLLEEGQKLAAAYRKRLGLLAEAWPLIAFQERVEGLIRLIPTLVGVKCRYNSEGLTIGLKGRSFSYPNPLRLLDEADEEEEGAFLMMRTPGKLTGENILTDGKGRTWLTDFASAGTAPPLWHFVSLEAAIRFDWLETFDLNLRHQMEQRLVDVAAFTDIDSQDIDKPVPQALRAIKQIRKEAKSLVGDDRSAYYWGLWYHAASRITSFNPTYHPTTSDLVRYAHALLALCMIGERLLQAKRGQPPSRQPSEAKMFVDPINHQVKIRGREITLRGQGYDLLCYLYQHAGELCSRQKLLEKALNEAYNPKDKHQINRLNMAIRRLRQKIEPDPSTPRYLITIPEAGYMLLTEG